MPLQQKDLELIETMLFKNCENLSIAFSRSIERMGEHIDTVETRMYSRIIELEDKIDDLQQILTDMIESVREDIRQNSMADE